MAKTQYLTYYIHLTDPDQVAAYQAQYPQGVLRAPDGAATEFAPAAGPNPLPIVTQGTVYLVPSISSPWFISTHNFPRNVATFTRKSGGWFGIPLLFGTTTRFFWVGQFTYAPPPAGTDPVTTTVVPGGPGPIMKRVWIDGFELPERNSGTSGENHTVTGDGSPVSRAASRVPGGYGLAIRGDYGRYQHDWGESGQAKVGKGWERFYVNRRDTGVGMLWATINAPAVGAQIQVLANGSLALYNNNVLKTTVGSLTLNQWFRIDIFTSFNTAGAGGTGVLKVFIDGVDVGGFTVAPADGGIGTNSSVQDRSYIGRLGGASNDGHFAVDVDDWFAAASPERFAWVDGVYAVDDLVYVAGAIPRWYKCITITVLGDPAPPSAKWALLSDPLDWVNGSHMQVIKPTGLEASTSGWTGDYRLLQAPGPSPLTGSTRITSTTALARLQVTTDVVTAVETLPGAIGASGAAPGAVAMVVGLYSHRGTLSGTLGWKFGAEDVAAITQGAGLGWNTRHHFPGAGTPTHATSTKEPFDISPLELIHIKGNDAVASNVGALHAVAEVLGQFGTEDRPATLTGAAAPGTPVVSRAATHNGPYPRSMWVLSDAPPISPVAIIGGTYVGNAGVVEIQSKFPIQWLFIRRVTVANAPHLWFSSMVGAHRASEEATQANIITCLQDPSYAGATALDEADSRWLIRIASSHTSINNSGDTYQYIAFCDPGMRFSVMGSLGESSLNTGSKDHPMQATAFTPIAAWLQKENTIDTFTTAALRYKGPGHTGAFATLLGSAEANNILEFLAGAMGSRSALHTALGDVGATCAYASFRRDDTSGDTGVPRVCYLGSYVGDGAASRSMAFSPASSRRPLFAAIVPHNATGVVWRDPSHTGVNSSTWDASGTSLATGITAGGLDGLTVGISLNASGVTYDVFVLWGSDTAGNGGWSGNGEFVPVEPDYVVNGGYDTVPDPTLQCIDPLTGAAITTGSCASASSGPVADPGDLTTDIAADCVVASTRLCNLALQELGITQQIANLGTEVSKEAQVARLAYKTVIDQVLRDFPWPFATRYALLTLVGGTSTVPVNRDWSYSYRMPTDAVYVRRIVPPSTSEWKRGAYPAIPFRMGQDTTGELVYTDLAIDTSLDPDENPQLEYTQRINCPASRGDAIFRQACIHRLAAAFAKPLSRESKDRDDQLKLYLLQLNVAKTVHMNEGEQQDDSPPDADWIAGR